MLSILYDGQNITANVQQNSIKKTEQLNNRANLVTFSVFDEKVEEGHIIEIFEHCTLREPFTAGGSVLQVSETFEVSNKFVQGDMAFIGFDTVNKKRVYVDSVDHLNRTITLTEPLAFSFPIGTTFGKLFFAGIVQNAPETEMTRGDCANPILERQVNVGDFRQLLDRKIIAETYEDMYLREILGRIVYKFCANDAESTFFDFETLGASAGVVGTQTFDTVDRIQGNKSIQFRLTGAGSGTATFTVPTINLTTYKKARFWWKVASANGQYIDTLKVRIGQNSSNYYEWEVANLGERFENCWSLESVLLDEPKTIVGTPTKTGVVFLQFYFEANSATATNSIHFDVSQVFNGGFTLQNCIRGDVIYDDIRVQYKKPTVAIENFTKLTGDYWFIDYERDIHYYGKIGEMPAPFVLSDTSQNFGDLTIDVDITNLRNRQTVRGGEAVDQTDYTQDEDADGVATSWRLDYKPKDLRIYVSNSAGGGGGFTQYSVGIENLVDENTVDYVYNFNEKTIRKTDGVPVPLNHTFRRVYKPYRPIRVRIQDNTSIAKMKLLTGADGIYDGSAIVEPKIKTFQEARQRAKAELDIYKNPIVTVSFRTNMDGLMPGQLLMVKDTDRGIDDSFLVQKVTWSSRFGDYWTYNVTVSSTLFGITEFLQLLLRRSDRWEVDVSEIVDIVVNIDEVITVQDAYTFTKKTTPFRAGTIETKNFDFKNERWTNSFLNSTNKQKYMGGWYSENLGSLSYSSSNCVFENPTLQIQPLDGNPREWATKTFLVGKEFGTGTLYKSHTKVDDKNGNTQSAMNFTESGYISIPYNGLASTPNELTIVSEYLPMGTVSGQGYTIFSWAGILITANQSKIQVWTNIGQPNFEYSRTNPGNWERMVCKIKYNSPNSTLQVLLDGKLVLDQTFAYNALAIGSRPNTTEGWIGSFFPNTDNRGFRGKISQLQVYSRLLTDRQTQEWSKGYTDREGLTLASGSATPSGNRPSAWKCYKVKPSTQYQIIGYTEILDTLTNDAGGGGIYLRVVGYNTRRIGGDSGHTTGSTFSQDFISAKKTKHDWDRIVGTFTTTATTEYINIGFYLFNATGVVRLNDLKLVEAGTETISNVAMADYSIAQ